jgi:nitrogen regulatory protein P-II 1
MKEIRAYIEPFMLSKVTQALLGIPDFPGMSVSPLRRFWTCEIYHWTRLYAVLAKKRIEIFAPDELVEIIFNTIMLTANTHWSGRK